MTFIKNNEFLHNRVSTEGGAIRFENPGLVVVEANNFIGNSADLKAKQGTEQTGGAIYYSCSPLFSKGCDVFLERNNFTRNVAVNSGGALRWVNKNFTSYKIS